MASNEYNRSKNAPNPFSSDRYNSLLNPFSRNRTEKEKRLRKISSDEPSEPIVDRKPDKFQEIFNPPEELCEQETAKDENDSADHVTTREKEVSAGKIRIQRPRSNSSPSRMEADDSSSDGHYESTESTITEIHLSESEEDKNVSISASEKEKIETTVEGGAESVQLRGSLGVINVPGEENEVSTSGKSVTSKEIATLQVPVIVHAPADQGPSTSGHNGTADVAGEDRDVQAGEATAAEEQATRYRSFGSVSKNASPSDSPLLSRTFGMKVERGREMVAVMGAGDYGTALSVRLRRAGYHVLLLTRAEQQARERLRELGCPAEEPAATSDHHDAHDAAVVEEAPEGVIEVLSREKGLPRASVVFMTVAGDVRLGRRLVSLLSKKILVQVSNRDPKKRDASRSDAEALQSLVPLSVVVKSLNTVPAWSLLWDTKLIPKQNPTCSDAAWAVYVVQSILRDVGISCTHMGELSNARKLELLPLTFFPQAHVAMIIIALVIFVFSLIALFRNQLCPLMQSKGSASDLFNAFLLENTKEVCGQTSLMLLTLTYLPGVVAAYVQLLRGTKYKAFPAFLDNWLKARKYLGLAAALIVVHHMLTILISVSFGVDFLRVDTSWMTPTALGLGAIGLVLLLVQSAFSIPSVSDQLTWAESRFVLSRLGWATYVIGIAHVILIKFSVLFNFTTQIECYFIIQGFQLVLFVAAPTIAAKIVLMLPCIDRKLTNIRKGKRNRRRSSRPAPQPRPSHQPPALANV